MDTNRRRERDVAGMEGWKMGRDIPLIRLGGLGERRELPSGVQGGAPAENKFGAFYLPQNPSSGRKIKHVIDNYTGTNT